MAGIGLFLFVSANSDGSGASAIKPPTPNSLIIVRRSNTPFPPLCSGSWLTVRASTKRRFKSLVLQNEDHWAKYGSRLAGADVKSLRHEQNGITKCQNQLSTRKISHLGLTIKDCALYWYYHFNGVTRGIHLPTLCLLPEARTGQRFRELASANLQTQDRTWCDYNVTSPDCSGAFKEGM